MNTSPAAEFAIVIPTRNRSDLARTAVLSALSASIAAPVRVVLSDNSTNPEESRKIELFVQSLGDARLTLLRPPQPLGMTVHWDWLMHQVLDIPRVGRVAYLTDRMVFRGPWLAEAVALSNRYPDDIVSYANDMLADDRRPVTYLPSMRSGKAFSIESASLLALSARMAFYTCLPRMLNCIVPRPHLDELRARHGSYFASTSPDFNFCYRSLGMRDSILYLDKSVMVCHGYGLSNGHSFVRGRRNEASDDFLSLLGNDQPFAETPLPEVATVGNAIASEYMKVRRDTAGPRMPTLCMDAYLASLAGETRLFDDAMHARDVRDVLRRVGWKPGPGFAMQGIKAGAAKRVRWLIERRFDDPVEGLRVASATLPRSFPWLHGAVRPYRCEEIPLEAAAG